MAQALPLAKLGGLLVKTLSKPLSKSVKHSLSQYKVGQYVLQGIGQASHQVTSRMTIWGSGYRVRSITPLEDKKALKAGAEFIGETVVLTTSAAWVVWEYQRSSKAAQEKEAKRIAQSKAERDALKQKLIALDLRVKALEEVVQHNSNSILNIGGKQYQEPKGIVSIQDDDDDEEDILPPISQSTSNEESSIKAIAPDVVVESRAAIPGRPHESTSQSQPTNSSSTWWKFFGL